ncbi:transporter substrate-binding domain-containing protein [Tranquillimonas alkanivorans]|uniref:Amino acid ABC transporter substrate-binding protein, PAAT family n=1 Tax=Tranquillimonas alkanivorans TaxID=441119 RepID=A0A1I5UIC4_9RHOB|nr:transporter substrate-binding domain-containing protein [Tranquillimonas alkanivorans]SFP95012.1 amino acid ABC transporter substrate-binding protein, PAAT family [Tranquillimonas alkanivorans]
MIAKHLASAAVGLALLGSTALSAAAQEQLTVGANIGNVPWEFQDDSGDFVGFEIDLVNEVADRLGAEVEIVNIPFNGLFSAVQSGRIDIATSSITITDERLESVSFAQPYYDSDQSLTVASGGPASLDEMEGKTVGVDTGSTGDMWATDHAEEYGFADIRRYEGLSPAMLDLTAGRIDGYISDIPALLYYVKDKPNLEVVQRIETGEKYSMMFAKDAELASEVNDIITELKEEGILADLHEKWFGATPEDTTSTVTVLPMPTLD